MEEPGVRIVDTVSDPYGTAVRGSVDEFDAARANPEYWLGQRVFDVAAGAATLTFGARVQLPAERSMMLSAKVSRMMWFKPPARRPTAARCAR